MDAALSVLDGCGVPRIDAKSGRRMVAEAGGEERLRAVRPSPQALPPGVHEPRARLVASVSDSVLSTRRGMSAL
jgi:hypothetical protein